MGTGTAGWRPGLWLWAVERQHAKRVSREMVELYVSVQLAWPQLVGAALYERVIMNRLGVNAWSARAFLRRAEESLPDWYADRNPTRRDIVWYVAVDEYMRSHALQAGTRTTMLEIVQRIVPRDL